MNTNELIAKLSNEAPKAKLRTPVYYGFRLMAVLLIYGVIAQLLLGFRPDLSQQFSRINFTTEIILLMLLSVLSGWTAILSMYPDMHQKKWLLNIPYLVFAVLVAFIILQLSMSYDSMMLVNIINEHNWQCTVCIASVSVIPSALFFKLMRGGASIHALRSGSFAVLAASGIGCLTIRFAEANDSLIHLIKWHYLPTLAFAMLGAWIGKKILKW
jgi:hypothetical protein